MASTKNSSSKTKNAKDTKNGSKPKRETGRAKPMTYTLGVTKTRRRYDKRGYTEK